MTGETDEEPLPEAVQAVLEDGERVRWHGHPDPKTSVVATLVGATVGAVLFGIVGALVATAIAGYGPVPLFVGLRFGLGIGALIGFAHVVLNELFGERHFVVTDSKAIKFEDLLTRRNREVARWEHVTRVDVERGLLNRLFETGTIRIAATRAEDFDYTYVPEPDDRAAQFRRLSR